MLCVVHTSDHSPCTFSSPRSKNCRKPRACLIWPNTGSTIALRAAYTAAPAFRCNLRVDRMSRKLHRKAGAAVYAARKAIVEPVFGQIKQARGFRQFLLRGLEKVQGEWSLVCTTHNILKLYRLYG